MKILDRSINWYDEYDNLPTLHIVVDKLPDRESRRYKTHKQGRSTSYWSELDGVVDFFTHVPGQEQGYGGRVFSGILEDGTPFSCKGPWSDNSAHMNGIFPKCVEVSVTETQGKYGTLRYASNLLLPLWVENVRLAGAEVCAIRDLTHNTELSLDQTLAVNGGVIDLEEINGGRMFAIKRAGMTLAQSQGLKRARRLIRYALDPHGIHRDRNWEAAIELIRNLDLKMLCERCLSDKPVDQSCGCFDNGGQ